MDQTTLLNGKFPTIFDYEDAADKTSSVIIDEIKGQSQLVLDASVIPTSAGFRHEIKRVIEKKYDAKTAAFDEGYVASGGTRTMKVAFETMRVTDAKEFDQLTQRLTSDQGKAEMAARIANIIDSIIRKKDECLLYGGIPHPDGSVDAKEVPGFASYLDEISDYDAMVSKWENGECPFSNENCMAIDNQDGASTSDASAVTDKQDERVWTSIYGFAFGREGAGTTYPANLPIAGYGMSYKMGLHEKTEDKYDGILKHRDYDLVTGEAAFGCYVANRFSLTGLRNIYLGHASKEDRFDEMYRVEQNLIKLADWFSLGETGMTMRFYTNRFLVHQLAEYLNNRIVRVDLGTNSNTGKQNNTNITSIEVVPGITVYSDFAIKRNEAFIA